ncbi:hypothetical protein M5U04_21155 [Xenorhabdus sp. XENO-1]|uniref:hypothetical protein n=1 Tax=Xenorhabdus bovienii TaxID=40576 RepID=UPI0020CA3BD0|nr:hypothetical protein [Xenorhabdus bovienii]MCP9270507.1 hypothetical protein [Xenorhabdus bovienii subsp. africana]
MLILNAEEMMENTDKVLSELIGKALSGMDGLIGFGKDQLPVVIEQLMLWKFWQHGLLFTLFLMLALLSGYIWKKAVESDIYDDFEVYLILFSAVCGFGFISIVCALNVIQIVVAPKVWLIEYAASLIK